MQAAALYHRAMLRNHTWAFFLGSGATAQPATRPPHSWGFYITHN